MANLLLAYDHNGNDFFLFSLNDIRDLDSSLIYRLYHIYIAVRSWMFYFSILQDRF